MVIKYNILKDGHWGGMPDISNCNNVFYLIEICFCHGLI